MKNFKLKMTNTHCAIHEHVDVKRVQLEKNMKTPNYMQVHTIACKCLSMKDFWC